MQTVTDKKNKMRLEHELPESIADWGWKFHHLGIPTKVKMPDEQYIPHLKLTVSGFSTSPFGIEWMRFDDDSPFDELIKTVPHLAFVVDDLENEIATRNLNVITEPNCPAEGIKVAMIKHNGAPVELMEFDNIKHL
jgi:hypothetical protein